MRKIVYLSMLLLALVCCLFIASCTNEDIDHDHNYVERMLNSNDEPCKGPTCVLDARREKVCIICNHVIPIEVIQATGHTPQEKWQLKTAPTCMVSKVEEKLCAVCGDVVETKVHEVVGHNPGDWQVVTNGTCTTNEVRGKLCITCGEVVETALEPLVGHKKNEEWQIVTNATCTDNLVKGKSCSVCGEIIETFVGEKLEHDYDESIVAGTCSKGEHKLYTCKLCGYFFESEFLKPTENHTEGGWIVEKAPTCSSEGVMAQICKDCAEPLSRQSVPVDPNNHSFLVETVPPTSEEEEGYVKYTCKNCGHEITNKYESNYLPSQIYEMIATSTVRIEGCGKDGKMHNVGSGFFISDSGEIVTNYHVIAGAHSLKVKLYSGEVLDVVAVKGYSVTEDIAILKVDLTGNSYLQLSTASVKTGDPVYTLGSPLGVDSVFTSGIISNPLKNVNGKNMIVFTAPISSGSSGGPLVNARGEVIGINNQVADNGQNLNFALLVNAIERVDVSADKTVYEVYTECLKVSGVNALTYYVMLNYDRRVGNRYIIEYETVEEVSGKYGRTVQLVYDGDKKELVVSTNWVDGGKHLYSIEYVLNGIKESYSVRFFDHGWSQYTLEGTVSTSTQAIDTNGMLDLTVFDKIYTIDYVNYGEASSSSLTKDIAKQLVGVAYLDMLKGFEVILDNADIDITLETFNFQPAQKQ